MNNFEIEEELAQKERFEIADDSGAEWALMKIKSAKAEAQKFADFYATQAAHASEEAENTVAFFTNLLVEYFEKVPHKTTKTGIEKYALPSGELIMKPLGIDFVHDDVKLLEWCKANHPEFIKTKETPSWVDIKKLVTETGEIPDGVAVIEKQASFSVKVEG